jgi:tetratricopeptide (TPR) repeat protein
VKKPQYITIFVSAVVLVLVLLFGKTVQKTQPQSAEIPAQNADKQEFTSHIAVDSLLANLEKNLPSAQRERLALLEKSILRGDIKDGGAAAFYRLANFWKDTVHNLIPYAWYTAEGARLENSEKSLTFAAHLFLDGMQQQENVELKKWMALQSKDLFERSLSINPDNDSSKVGIGAAYLFGGISQNPMEGLSKLQEVVKRDSTNVYAQMTLVMASLMSGQTEKAKDRLFTVSRLQPKNAEVILLLGEIFEREGNKETAISYYTKAGALIERPDIKKEIDQRISELRK